MTRPGIISLYDNFVNEERRQSDLVTRALSFLEFRGGAERPIIANHKYLITEICFLRVLLAWETFLEESFPRMLCGASRRRTPQPRPIVKYREIEHTKQVIKGGREFINWINPDEVIRLANLHFKQGEPFLTPFQSAFRDLDEIRVIRNRIAHSSNKASQAFTRLIRSRYGYVPKGMLPGRYLLDSLPSTIPHNHYQYYSQVLLAVASLIVG